jgi:predicted acyl esterase
MPASPATAAAATGAAAAGAASSLRSGGSVDEAWLTGAQPGDHITLLRFGSAVSNPANPGAADSLGSLIIRDLSAGRGYSWRDDTTGEQTADFTVLAPGVDPSTGSALYTGQRMHKGLNYITMRDGIKLAATVRYPYGTSCSAANPCPTVVEYSGYNVAGPTDPIPFLIASFLGIPCSNCGDPNLLPSSSTYVGAVLARFSGFATVSLQMRGTGCSGGAFDLFGYPSDFDAYDATEIVAHQPWVANHRVGMVGISYSGLSQFPSAGTDPPALAAIAPLSPTDDLFSTGYPGGIYNNGFAASWVSDRIDDAKPAATYLDGKVVQSSPTPVSGVGQPWTYYEIDAELAADNGRSTCLADQALHGQSEQLDSIVGPQLVAPGTGAGRDPSLFDRRSMVDWAPHVIVPVFLSGALQDDQTGPQWPSLINAIPETTPVFANMVNGGHIDSLDPQTISRWLEFLDIYVAHRVPTSPIGIDTTVLDQFAALAAGVPSSEVAPLPPTRFTGARNLTVARDDFAAQTPRVRVLFDSGAGPVGPGGIQSTYSADFDRWPPKGGVSTLRLGPDGALGAKPAVKGSTTFTLDPSVRPATSLPPGGNPWAAQPDWDWTPVPPADGIAFQTAPFTVPTTIAGPATLELWVKSATPVVDFQATITEVQPQAGQQAGQEEYITSGFLRSDNQADNRDSTPLFTDPTYLQGDERYLSSTRYSLVKIPIDPIVHTFRAGTALRVVVSAPGGDRPEWTFDTLDAGQQATVGLGGHSDSALVVNVVQGVDATPTLPVCGSLRGEPCRAYVAEGNQPGS